MLLLNFCLRSILWMACVFTSKLQVKLSSQFYSWSSITREETFRKFYRNFPYLNPFCLLTSLNSEPWTWQRAWRKPRVKNNRILTVESNFITSARMLSSWHSLFHLFPSAKLTFPSQWLSQDISLFLHEISVFLEISLHKSLSLFNSGFDLGAWALQCITLTPTPPRICWQCMVCFEYI